MELYLHNFALIIAQYTHICNYYRQFSQLNSLRVGILSHLLRCMVSFVHNLNLPSNLHKHNCNFHRLSSLLEHHLHMLNHFSQFYKRFYCYTWSLSSIICIHMYNCCQIGILPFLECLISCKILDLNCPYYKSLCYHMRGLPIKDHCKYRHNHHQL